MTKSDCTSSASRVGISSTPISFARSLRHVRVERDHAHPERDAALRDERADATEPDDAERLALELDALPLRAVPMALLQVLVRLRDVPGLREQRARSCARRPRRCSTEGAFTTITPRRVAASTSTLSSPMPARATTLRLSPASITSAGDLRLRTDDERVVRRDRLGETLGGELGTHVDLEVLAEQIEARVRQRLGDEDLHGDDAPLACVRRRSRPGRRPRPPPTAAPRLTGWPSRSSVISSAARPRTMSSSLK